MLNIDSLSLHLPSDLQSRGDNIARLIGQALSDKQVEQSLTVAELKLSPLTVDRNSSDQVIASQIADEIFTKVRGVV